MSSIICGSNQNRSSRLGLGESNVLCFSRIRAGDLRSSPSGNPRPVAEVTLSRPLSPAHSRGWGTRWLRACSSEASLWPSPTCSPLAHAAVHSHGPAPRGATHHIPKELRTPNSARSSSMRREEICKREIPTCIFGGTV